MNPSFCNEKCHRGTLQIFLISVWENYVRKYTKHELELNMKTWWIFKLYIDIGGCDWTVRSDKK